MKKLLKVILLTLFATTVVGTSVMTGANADPGGNRGQIVKGV